MAVEGSGQPLGILLLRDHHPVHPQLFQHLPVGLIVGLADDVGNAQFLQVHGDQHGSGQVVPDGDDRAVQVPDPQGPQNLFVLGIAHNRVGHIVGDLLNIVALHIQGQNLRPQLAQLTGQSRAEPAQSDNRVGFHIVPP